MVPNHPNGEKYFKTPLTLDMEYAMYPRLKEDHDLLPALMEAVCAHASGVCTNIDSSPVAVKPRQFVLSELPARGIGAEAVLQLFGSSVSPSLSASAGPRHLGFVTGGATPAAMLGDWLTSVYDQNPVSNLDSATALQVERHTVAMLRSLFGLSSEFEGTLVSGATMSNFVGLAVAREWAGRACGVRVSDEGISAMPRPGIFSATPHSSTTKALSMLGIGRKMWQEIPSLLRREAMDMGALEQRLAACAGPAIIIASAGTVNTGDFDDFTELVRLKQSYGFYLHIDAAFGGFASVSPDLRPLLKGWSCADSICIDLHKWLNVPYDSAVAFTRHRDLQMDVFANVSAYLSHDLDDPEPVHLAPENSHRWRALPAWFTLMAYGEEGYREIVERDCRLARKLGQRLQQSDDFELLAPVQLNIVCFALKNPDVTARFIEAVRDSGRTLVTPTVFKGTPAIRAAFSNWRTTDVDLDIAWQAFQTASRALSKRRTKEF